MGRIRTIKPEFYQHYELWEAEQETGLPLRVAFSALWTQCDREGRFQWRPQQLKITCLPYDEVDFSRVLDALTTRGFLVKYASNGREFGAIPSWSKHQVINNREKASELPEPPDTNGLTREPRVDDACTTRAVRKGREGKGREDSEAKASGEQVAAPSDDEGRKKQSYQIARRIKRPSAPTELLKCGQSWAEIFGIMATAESKADPPSYLAWRIKSLQAERSGSDPPKPYRPKGLNEDEIAEWESEQKREA